MNGSVAFPTKCDEILFGVVAEPISRRNVVNFKVGKGTTNPATPPVAFQYRVLQDLIGFRIEAKPRTLRAKPHHLAIGRPSRLAPARKSAQIISRQ
jgi:hypothetical protein